jgi:hypothetical protein
MAGQVPRPKLWGMDFEAPEPFAVPSSVTVPAMSVASKVAAYVAALQQGVALKRLAPAVDSINQMTGAAPMPEKPFPAVWRLGPCKGQQWGEWHASPTGLLQAGPLGVSWNHKSRDQLEAFMKAL